MVLDLGLSVAGVQACHLLVEQMATCWKSVLHDSRSFQQALISSASFESSLGR